MRRRQTATERPWAWAWKSAGAGMARGARRVYLAAMVLRLTSLERAFALARTGEYAGVADIRRKLREEGYDTVQLAGPVLMKQLRERGGAARPTPET